MIEVYGIKNCSTVKKALDWLNKNNIEYSFHDYKKEGISEEKIKEWQEKFGWEPLINRKGTTWRKLDKDKQESITDRDAANKLMQEYNSLIKRPIIDGEDVYLLGFDIEEYAKNLL